MRRACRGFFVFGGMMLAFLHNCIQPDAVTMFVLALICLFAEAYPSYRAGGSMVWLLFLFAGVLAAIAWIMLVFR